MFILLLKIVFFIIANSYVRLTLLTYSSEYTWSVKLKVGKTNTSDQNNITLERPVAKIVLLCKSE